MPVADNPWPILGLPIVEWKAALNVQFMVGDVGMIHVWFCFQCLTPQASMECY